MYAIRLPHKLTEVKREFTLISNCDVYFNILGSPRNHRRPVTNEKSTRWWSSGRWLTSAEASLAGTSAGQNISGISDLC